jgi:hypothetical protein
MLEMTSQGRKFREQLRQECCHFLDANASHHAMTDMPPSVFWELYLAHALRRSGINIVEQNRTKKKQRGPDLRATNPDVWIEAVVAYPGSGEDALEAPPRNGSYEVPVDDFILRLRNAIETKSRIIKGYIQDKIIQQEQAAVIAISGCMLYTQFLEQPIPRIVRAALGVGYLVLDVNKSTGAHAGYSLEHRDGVQKAKGARVKTDIFLDPAYAHVSALIYSASDWVNTPYEPGNEFIVIHNENATAKLPHGWLPVGDEYWREQSALRCVRHSASEG